MLLGYIVLGAIWMGDADLKAAYEEYETWLDGTENSAPIKKWCTILKETNFEKNKENRARYIEVFKFIFREVTMYLKF